jgi:hypothetical protein
MEPELNSREALLEMVRELRVDLNDAIGRADVARIDVPGVFGEWSFKDLIGHLTGWRTIGVALLEGGVRGDAQEPELPWPRRFDDADGPHEINAWFHAQRREMTFDEILRESDETFARIEQAIRAMPEDALLDPGHFAWLTWSDEALGPAIVRGTYNHYHRAHEPDILAWLARG